MVSCNQLLKRNDSKISWKHVNNTWNTSIRVAVVKCDAARAVEGLWRTALIHTSSCRVIHDNIKQMRKCDVACSWLEPSLLRVHTDIKWSDGLSAVETSAVFSHSRWLWTAIPQEYQSSVVNVTDEEAAESCWHVGLHQHICSYMYLLTVSRNTLGNKLHSITVWALWCVRAEDFFGVFSLLSLTRLFESYHSQYHFKRQTTDIYSKIYQTPKVTCLTFKGMCSVYCLL